MQQVEEMRRGRVVGLFLAFLFLLCSHGPPAYRPRRIRLSILEDFFFLRFLAMGSPLSFGGGGSFGLGSLCDVGYRGIVRQESFCFGTGRSRQDVHPHERHIPGLVLVSDEVHLSKSHGIGRRATKGTERPGSHSNWAVRTPT